MENPASFIIAGPTAVGKSELAVAIAERCDGEIVSADAFQIYAGLDLLTAKPAAELRAKIPHCLIGEVPLTESWDVARWLEAAHQRIAEIHARGCTAIIVGGTGLYLRALTRGLAALPPASAALRSELGAQPLDQLCQRLAELDPESDRTIDLKNPRRVIRALEVCLLTGQPFSSFREQWSETPSGWKGVVLTRERTELYARIDRRTEEMFAAGVVEEVRAIGEVGATASQTLGLREIRALLAGELSQSECIASIQMATRHYAKRQLTWFRRESDLRAIDRTAASNERSLAEEIARELRGG